MSYISTVDRTFIENKYHRTDLPFDPYKRYAYHGYEYDESTGFNDEEMNTALEKLFEETRHLPHSLAKAKAFAFVLDHMRIDVNGHDYFVGLYNWGRPLQQTFVQKWWTEMNDSMPDTMQQIQDYSDSGTASVWLDMEHFVPGWEDIMHLGIPGLLKRVQTYKKSYEDEYCSKNDSNKKYDAQYEEHMAFWESMELEYSAILRLIHRLGDYAGKQKHEKAALVAESMQHLEEGAPQSFFDALQLMYLFFMCSEYVEQFQSRSMGNGLDYTLFPFYQKDLENGKFTVEDIKKFLAYFLLQFYAIGHPNGHPFYLGGIGADGVDRVTQLSYDILDVYEELNIHNPKIQIKLHQETPDKFLDKTLRMIRSGKGLFVFCCQPGMIKSLTSCYGVSYEEACECDISGCNEMHVKANEACMISALPNAAKAISYVFQNGVDSITGKHLGLSTGDVTQFTTFDEFYGAFLKQFAYIIDTCIDIANKRECYISQINPSVLLSATIKNSLETMQDAYGFGVKYPTSALLLCSFATAVDSILAVKELVFDTKQTTMRELRDALENNWEGYEDLRKLSLNAKHKYGNGDVVADKFASELFRWFAEYVNGRPNSRGGVYKTGVPSTLEFISQGKLTEATPDGRKMGDECSKNIAPVVGAERKGVTGTLRSGMSLDTHLFSEACVLDMLIHPSAIQGDDGLTAMKGLIYTFMKNDGISIQFNVFSSDTLREAQQHPEKYRNLQVRITGWNALWNQLSAEEQEAYIIRAESIK